MTNPSLASRLRRVTFVVVAALMLSGASVAQASITELQAQFEAAAEAKTKSRKRRAYRSAVRKARELLESAPEGAQRWRVLQLVFRGQKQLLILERSAAHRDDLLETCRELANAPDEFAHLRLESDLLLSEQRLAAAGADLDERARALEAVVARYRDTPGEAKSLMMASQIAPKLEAFELETRILRAMQERFADDHEIIEFRRKSLAAGRIEALFRGGFTRTDGQEIRFPIDRTGHQALVVFWSKRTPGFENALATIGEYRAQFPGRFDFYSLNLDELPDAGEATLRSLKLDWTALRLPGGRQSQMFRTFGRRDPVSILINAYGYTLLTPTNEYGRGHGKAPVNPYAIDPVRLTDARYLAQLQSLFVGDFLMPRFEGLPEDSPLAETLRAIHDSVPPAPMRYRLTRSEALAAYERVGRLCQSAVAAHADDPELWRVRSCQVLALLGRWKMSGEPEFLEAAVKKAALEIDDSRSSAQLVPRYCLAKAALRDGEKDPEAVLGEFVDAFDSSLKSHALAAAAILAIDCSSRELHQRYRTALLKQPNDEPALWPVTSFLRDRYHRLDLLKVKLNRPERRIRRRYGDDIAPRSYAINHGLEPMVDRLPDIELKTLDGGVLSLPRDAEGKLTLLLFVEPPSSGDDFPVTLDRQGRPTKNDALRTVVGYAIERAALHVHDEVRVVLAFLSDDPDRVRALMEQNEWDCDAALVPGGLNSATVRRLGILSADRNPNVFLLRRDGTVAWHISGFAYRSDFGWPFAIRLAMKVHIEVCDTELAFSALAAGEFEEAKRIFSGPFVREKDERYRWRAPRLHGRALAHAGLNDWSAALADIDAAIVAHREEFDHDERRPHAIDQLLRRARADILDELGRAEDAAEARKSAEFTPKEAPVTLYEQFHRRLLELAGR